MGYELTSASSRLIAGRILVACTAVVLLTAIGVGSVSADESVPTTTTVVEQFDEESGLIFSQVDDHTIEISLPD